MKWCREQSIRQSLLFEKCISWLCCGFRGQLQAAAVAGSAIFGCDFHIAYTNKKRFEMAETLILRGELKAHRGKFTLHPVPGITRGGHLP